MALTINSLDIYLSDLLKENGKIRCIADTTSLLCIGFGYARFIIFFIAPIVLITSLYCAIAVTLRKQDKMLQCATVRNRNDHKKRQVIKMSLCIVCLFYLLFLPYVTALVLWETRVSKMFLYKHLFLVSILARSCIFDNKSNRLFYICGKLPSWPKRSFQLT